MPHADANGVKLYFEEAGEGPALIFAHEFAGDHRSWEPQMRHFSRRYRCICYNARGYPPSDVPEDFNAYSQEIVADDIAHVLDHLNIEKAHICGLSMGGFATLHFGLRHPQRALSLVVAGCGYGASPTERETFQNEAEALAARFESEGADAIAKAYASGPTRIQFENKDPRGYAEFVSQLAEHSPVGAAGTLRGYLKRRPSLFDLEDQLRKLTVPTLIVTGDEDEPCLEPDLFLKRTIPSAGLSVIPKSGHTINIEEPDIFNGIVQNFLTTVETGRWGLRDKRSLSGSALLGGR
ncbi:MAG: alpha/beta fold hydrolase [Alphaproteobacteria bacterium]